MKNKLFFDWTDLLMSVVIITVITFLIYSIWS